MPESLKLHFGQTVKGSYIYGISFPSMSYDSIPINIYEKVWPRYGLYQRTQLGQGLGIAKQTSCRRIQVNDVSNGHHSIGTVDGSHPLIGSVSLYLQGFILIPTVGFLPSTVSCVKACLR